MTYDMISFAMCIHCNYSNVYTCIEEESRLIVIGDVKCMHTALYSMTYLGVSFQVEELHSFIGHQFSAEEI